MAIEQLSDSKIRNAKTKEKQYKLTDGGGLFLVVHPNGSKYWRYRYYLDGKEKLYAIGVYPTISLKLARELHKQAKTLVALKVDPVEHRREQDLNRRLANQNTFEQVAREWYDKQCNLPH